MNRTFVAHVLSGMTLTPCLQEYHSEQHCKTAPVLVFKLTTILPALAF